MEAHILNLVFGFSSSARWAFSGGSVSTDQALSPSLQCVWDAFGRLGWSLSNDLNSVAALREIRDQMLADTDWTQLSDAPISVNDVIAWAGYRQSLRDLPASWVNGWGDVTWPDIP